MVNKISPEEEKKKILTKKGFLRPKVNKVKDSKSNTREDRIIVGTQEKLSLEDRRFGLAYFLAPTLLFFRNTVFVLMRPLDNRDHSVISFYLDIVYLILLFNMLNVSKGRLAVISIYGRQLHP